MAGTASGTSPRNAFAYGYVAALCFSLMSLSAKALSTRGVVIDEDDLDLFLLLATPESAAVCPRVRRVGLSAAVAAAEGEGRRGARAGHASNARGAQKEELAHLRQVVLASCRGAVRG